MWLSRSSDLSVISIPATRQNISRGSCEMAKRWPVQLRSQCISNRVIALSLFLTFSRQNSKFLSLLRAKAVALRVYLDDRSSQTGWETCYATVCLHWKSTIRATTKRFSAFEQECKDEFRRCIRCSFSSRTQDLTRSESAIFELRRWLRNRELPYWWRRNIYAASRRKVAPSEEDNEITDSLEE